MICVYFCFYVLVWTLCLIGVLDGADAEVPVDECVGAGSELDVHVKCKCSMWIENIYHLFDRAASNMRIYSAKKTIFDEGDRRARQIFLARLNKCHIRRCRIE